MNELRQVFIYYLTISQNVPFFLNGTAGHEFFPLKLLQAAEADHKPLKQPSAEVNTVSTIFIVL